jgi:Zn-dependent protease
MQAHIRLGRIAGIPIGLHYTWLLIALLITLSLAGHFGAVHGHWDRALVWAVAVVTALLFFVTLLAHELMHALVARGFRLPVRSITLFALGGLARIEKDAGTPKAEFWIAVAGPVASAAIGGGCLALAFALGWRAGGEPQGPVGSVLVWLGYINLVLAGFNMLPAFPLDGGRVLRAIVWWATGDGRRALRTAARVGQVLALVMIAFGFFRFFGGAGFGALWIALIGWFLFEAAQASVVEAEVTSALERVRVADIMTTDCPVVDAATPLDRFVEDYLLRTGRRCFLVGGDGRVAGLVTTHEVRAVPRTDWPHTTVGAVMRPLDAVQSVRPEAPAAEALAIMVRQDVNQLPVMAGGRLAGLVSRAHILQLVQTQQELGA